MASESFSFEATDFFTEVTGSYTWIRVVLTNESGVSRFFSFRYDLVRCFMVVGANITLHTDTGTIAISFFKNSSASAMAKKLEQL